MPATVEKGATLHTQWTLYAPTDLTALVDPDEFPSGPRFQVVYVGGPQDGQVVDGFDQLAYTRRVAAGIYNFDLPIPFSDGILDPGDYAIQPILATKGGNPLVGQSGSAPTAPFTVVAGAEDFSGDRLYVSTEELAADYGLTDAQDFEVRFAQQVCDDWMHRPSLWPSIYEAERHDLPTDRNLIQLDVTPVIRLFGVQAGSPVTGSDLSGRLGYGRRDRRSINQIGRDWLSSMAVISSPPVYQPIDPTRCNLHHETGQVWLPISQALAYYTEVECTYEAGYRVIQKRHKWAIAETINWVRTVGFGSIKGWKQGQVSQEMVEGLITPEVAKRLDKDRVVVYR